MRPVCPVESESPAEKLRVNEKLRAHVKLRANLRAHAGTPCEGQSRRGHTSGGVHRTAAAAGEGAGAPERRCETPLPFFLLS